jgi:Tol biopolymer transport system component
MGEVYKARDTRLDRTVAIKVLPQLFASDPIFRTRFDREARAISALNHPNICTLHDIGTEGSTAYLVMECVEGQAAEGPLPVARALAIAIQICDALEAAHRAGIVHRDLKPSNILVSKSGVRPHVKLLDFGLATRVEAAHAREGERATISALTGGHTIVGTPQYMAPEQIEGRDADARSDIFALGCVLYELLTGKHAFEGNSPSTVMAAILAKEPRPIRDLVPITPPTLDWIVMRALAKDPNDRWQTVRDLRAALERVLAEPQPAAPRQPLHRNAPVLVAGAVTLLAIAVAAAALTVRRPPPAPAGGLVMSEFIPPTRPIGPAVFRLALSPDGRRLAFTAPDANGRLTLWVRALDSLSAQPLPGTTNAAAPFWSPDSRFIAFQAEGKLKRVDAAGGTVTTICSMLAAPPGTWSRDDVILITGDSSIISRVPASGGTPTPVLKLDETAGERVQLTPAFLPDGRHFVYVSALPGSRVRAVYLASLDGDRGSPLIADATGNVVYADGYLLFLRNSTLLAQPFDPAALKLSGDPKPVAEDILVNPATGTGAFTASQNGILAYQTSTNGDNTSLTWYDRTGKNLGNTGEYGGFFDLRLAPDAKHATVTLPSDSGRASQVWVYDLQRKVRTQFTFDAGPSAGGVWSPDGSEIIYAKHNARGSILIRKAASGAGGGTVVFEDKVNTVLPLDWSRNGFLLYEQVLSARSGKLGVLSLTGAAAPHMFLGSTFSEIPAQFSPDGRWVAYVSDQSSRQKEVFVTSFPNRGAVRQISAAGGDFPRWKSDSSELFYLTADALMSVPLTAKDGQIDPGEVKKLFDVRWAPSTRSPYDVAPDGQRFLFNVFVTGTAPAPITIVTNWTEKIKN